MALGVVDEIKRGRQHALGWLGFRSDRSRAAAQLLNRQIRDLDIVGVRITPGSLRRHEAAARSLDPFDVDNRFVWLRQALAVEGADGLDVASVREKLNRWLRAAAHHRAPDPIHVVADRLYAVIISADVLCGGDDAGSLDLATHTRLMDLLSDDLAQVCAGWPDLETAQDRARAIMTALLVVHAVELDRGRREDVRRGVVESLQTALTTELDAQIAVDGSHVSRNGAVVVELLLDLVPLLRLYAYFDEDVPPTLGAFRIRMQRHLRTLRFCDGRLAPFHGSDAVQAQRLATALRLDPSLEAFDCATPGNYRRLERGPLTLICDTAPVDESSGATGHASFGSFILSDKGQPILLHCGHASAEATQADQARARAAAAHNVLVLDASSFATATAHPSTGAMRLCGPPGAKMVQTSDENGIKLAFHHDGYIKSYGLAYERTLFIASAGDFVVGTEQLGGASGRVRFAQDIPYAVHFHVAGDVIVRRVSLGPGQLVRADAGAMLVNHRVDLELPDGSVWAFETDGPSISIEQSRRYGRGGTGLTGPQLALRAATPGESLLMWRIRRIGAEG